MAKAHALVKRTNKLAFSFVLFLMAFSVLVLVPHTTRAQQVGESFADLVDEISPAVVNIVTSVAVTDRTGPQPMVPEGSPLEDLFRDFLDRQEQDDDPQFRGEALGSGFIISEDGYVVTNNHVIAGADEIEVELFSGEILRAELVGTDERTDIAVLKLTADEPFPFVEFGDSDIARVGDWVIAIGNPLGQGFSVSTGIISARNRTLSGSYDDFIQTDAAINRGNSGGPLFNMDGDVIGVNTAILSPSGGSIGIGFSMSSAVVERVVAQLIEFGETSRGWLGVRIQDISEDVAEALELASTDGALVTDVPDGPALDAGMEPGDVIIVFDGEPIEDTRELVSVVAETDVGRAVDVLVLRDGVETTIGVTLGRLEEAVLASSSPEEDLTPDLTPEDVQIFGMTLEALNEESRDTLGLSEDTAGVLINNVDDNSVAFDKGLRAGDVILEIGQQVVETPDQLVDRVASAIDAGRSSILLLVSREGDRRFVALALN